MAFKLLKKGTKLESGEIYNTNTVFVYRYHSILDKYPNWKKETDKSNKEFYLLDTDMPNKLGSYLNSDDLDDIAYELNIEIDNIKNWQANYFWLQQDGDICLPFKYQPNAKIDTVFSQSLYQDIASVERYNSNIVTKPILSELGLFLESVIEIGKTNNRRFEKLTSNSLNLIKKNYPSWQNPKPVLRRLSTLSSDQSKYYGVSNLWSNFYCKGKINGWWVTQNFQPWSLARLASHHFDVFGWIDTGHAINVDTLNKNPYSPFH